MNWRAEGAQQWVWAVCYILNYGNKLNPKSHWLNTVKISLSHVESAELGSLLLSWSVSPEVILSGEDGARLLLKSQAKKWFIALCPSVAEQNSVIWPQVNFQGRLGNIVFLCVQEEKTVWYTHPVPTPFPCNHLGGYFNSLDNRQWWSGLEEWQQRGRDECLGKIYENPESLVRQGRRNCWGCLRLGAYVTRMMMSWKNTWQYLPEKSNWLEGNSGRAEGQSPLRHPAGDVR